MGPFLSKQHLQTNVQPWKIFLFLVTLRIFWRLIMFEISLRDNSFGWDKILNSGRDFVGLMGQVPCEGVYRLPALCEAPTTPNSCPITFATTYSPTGAKIGYRTILSKFAFPSLIDASDVRSLVTQIRTVWRKLTFLSEEGRSYSYSEHFSYFYLNWEGNHCAVSLKCLIFCCGLTSLVATK